MLSYAQRRREEIVRTAKGRLPLRSRPRREESEEQPAVLRSRSTPEEGTGRPDHPARAGRDRFAGGRRQLQGRRGEGDPFCLRPQDILRPRLLRSATRSPSRPVGADRVLALHKRLG